MYSVLTTVDRSQVTVILIVVVFLISFPLNLPTSRQNRMATVDRYALTEIWVLALP